MDSVMMSDDDSNNNNTNTNTTIAGSSSTPATAASSGVVVGQLPHPLNVKMDPLLPLALGAVQTHGAGIRDQETMDRAALGLVNCYRGLEPVTSQPESLLVAMFWNLAVWSNQYDLTLYAIQSIINDFLQRVSKSTSRKDAKSLLALPERIADVDFHIRDTPLSHSFDVEAFVRQVKATRTTWEKYRDHREAKERYNAPYFCFVQSSGMGKTKIMYEAIQTLIIPMKKQAKRKQENTEDEVMGDEMDEDKDVVTDKMDKAMDQEAWKCALILPSQLKSRGKDSLVFLARDNVTFPPITTSDDDADVGARKGFAALDTLLDHVLKKSSAREASDNSRCPVLLCFDESQVYLEDVTFSSSRGEKTILKAFWFRVIRLWLRLRKHSRHTVVAVFAGTTASLSNFRKGDDDDILGSTTSRDWTASTKRYDKGVKYFPVFSMTTTIGCLAATVDSTTEATSEYHRAIPYGRPLFALLHKSSLHNESDRLTAILGRMLQSSNEEWKESDSALLSVLATRVQMGQTTFNVASKLVAHGYANLLGVSEKSAHITYMPDPVCSRLAMCMMADGFRLDPFKGIGGRFWSKQASRLFQCGLCIPEKGNAGEIFVALYFLLCGDKLRQNASSDFTVFKVSLAEWLCLVRDGGGEARVHSAVPHASAVRTSPRVAARQDAADSLVSNEQSPDPDDGAEDMITDNWRVEINFVQVCRNNLRSFGWDWVGLGSQTFLRHLYHSAIAFYVYPGCPLIDFVAPIKIQAPGTDHPTYVPLLVSIKSRGYYSPSDARHQCLAMKDKAIRSNLKTALCLLVVLGSTKNSNDRHMALNDAESIVKSLVASKIVSKVLRIPSDDEFSISKHFRAATSDVEQVEELLASHAFIRAFDGDEEDLSPDLALRANAPQEATEMLGELKEALKNKARI
jgi:hypothetical protein